mmetsp:Transcript_128688/g.223148  ORF Transcript_128688/g.223148 Transcript_128688/m.223148 type:complete len:488 (+) Transcript_128688:44-1507(+)
MLAFATARAAAHTAPRAIFAKQVLPHLGLQGSSQIASAQFSTALTSRLASHAGSCPRACNLWLRKFCAAAPGVTMNGSGGAAVVMEATQVAGKVASEATKAAGKVASDAAGQAASRVGALVRPGYEVPVGVWLLGTSGMLYTMIAIGGYTRLSGSGLSMTDWRIQGRSLPWTQEQWVREFEEYKTFPEYQRLHAGMMDLQDFKHIYFVEWFHRMWGRTVGMLFAVPLAYFIARRILKARLALLLTGFLGLGLSQAFVGWWMVQSGLENPEKHTPTLGKNQRPRVSPYRLANHWTAALTLYFGCLWTSLSLLRPSPSVLHPTVEAIAAAKKLRCAALPVAALVGLTLLSGPFVAGNDAGHAYNTWPKMNYDWVPPEWLAAVSEPLKRWRLFFEDTAVVQFDHRCLAYASVFGTLGLAAYSSLLPVSPAVGAAVRLLPWAVGAQMCLGVATLLLYVPIELGVAHQAGGVAVLTSLAFLLHTLRIPVMAL